MPSADLILPFLLCAVAAYIIGSISFSIIVTGFFAGTDVRNHGSGNAGTTNVLRTAGKLPAILTFVGDVLKAVAAIGFAIFIFYIFGSVSVDSLTIRLVAGIFCVIGHIFPIFFGFRGGKGVATAAGVVLMVSWQSFLIVIGIFVLLVLITRIVSLSAIIAAAVLPFTVWCYLWLTHNSFLVLNTLLITIVAVILIVKHRANIKRLIKGVEPKLGQKKSE